MILQCEAVPSMLVENLSVQYCVLSLNLAYLANVSNKLTVFDLKRKTNVSKTLDSAVVDIQFQLDSVFVLYNDQRAQALEANTLKESYLVKGVQAVYLNDIHLQRVFLRQGELRVSGPNGQFSTIRLAHTIGRDQKPSFVCEVDWSSNRLCLFILSLTNLEIINLTDNTSIGLVALDVPLLRIIKTDNRIKILDSKLNYHDFNMTTMSLSGPNPTIPEALGLKESFEPFQVYFAEEHEMLAIYCKTDLCFYDLSFKGNYIQTARKYKLGIQINLFRYGFSQGTGLFMYNRGKDIESVKITNIYKQKEEIPSKEVRKVKVMQRESKIIKQAVEPTVSSDSKNQQSKPLQQVQSRTQIKGVIQSNLFLTPSVVKSMHQNTPQPPIVTGTTTSQIDPKVTGPQYMSNVHPQNQISSLPTKRQMTESVSVAKEANTKVEPGSTTWQASTERTPFNADKPHHNTVMSVSESQVPNQSSSAKQALLNRLSSKLETSVQTFKQTLASQSNLVEMTLKSSLDQLKEFMKKGLLESCKTQMLTFIKTDLHDKLEKYFTDIFLKVNATYQSGNQFSENRYLAQKSKYDTFKTELVDKKFEALEQLLQDVKQFLIDKQKQTDNIPQFEAKIQELSEVLRASTQRYNECTGNREKVDHLLQQRLTELQKLLSEQEHYASRSIKDSQDLNKKTHKFYIVKKKD